MMIMTLSLWSRSCGRDMLAGSIDRGRSAAASDFTRPVDIMEFSHLLKVLCVYIPITHIVQSDQVTCHCVPKTIYLPCRLQLQCNYIDVYSSVCHNLVGHDQPGSTNYVCVRAQRDLHLVLASHQGVHDCNRISTCMTATKCSSISWC